MDVAKIPLDKVQDVPFVRYQRMVYFQYGHILKLSLQKESVLQDIYVSTSLRTENLFYGKIMIHGALCQHYRTLLMRAIVISPKNHFETMYYLPRPKVKKSPKIIIKDSARR